ncbi:MAG: ROK family transcriptional regulator [Oscillospiraceae bacterium]
MSVQAGSFALQALGDSSRINVLRLIHEHKDISRTDLAKKSHLSLSAVSRIVKQLLDDGYILETGYGDSNGGRKPINIRVNPHAGYIIGVDFGKTAANAGVFDFSGDMISQYIVQIHDNDYLTGIYAAIDNCVESLEDPSKLLLIYCGVRGLLDNSSGTIVFSLTFGWSNIPLKQLLSLRYNVPVALDINARLAALGEWSTIYKDTISDLAYITTSWGICAGVISNGKLFYGARGLAGEIGNSLVFTDRTMQPYSKLEELCGGQMLIRRACEMWESPQNLLLKKLTGNDSKKLTVEDIVAAVNSNDAFAVSIAHEAAAVLATGLINVVFSYNPQIIVIGGLLSEMGSVILTTINDIMKERLPAPIFESVRVELTVLGSRSSLVGAAQAAFRLLFSSPTGLSNDPED